MILIRGSGFGLYGYLPALVNGCGQSVVLPERYLPRLLERSELAHLRECVFWEKDDEATLLAANGVVCALPPIAQEAMITEFLAYTNIKYLLLEKPLGNCPEAAIQLHRILLGSDKIYRLGYTFRYTAWGQRLIETLKTNKRIGHISIHWSFLAHHYKYDLQNWKRFHSTGGGAIRFYGIHLIALLAEIGYSNIKLSRVSRPALDECESWCAIFTGPCLPECEIIVETRAVVRKFIIKQASIGVSDTGLICADLNDPFDSEFEFQRSGKFDPRVSVLTKLCRSLFDQSSGEYDWYNETIRLWAAAEAICVESTRLSPAISLDGSRESTQL